MPHVSAFRFSGKAAPKDGSASRPGFRETLHGKEIRTGAMQFFFSLP
jgi:hypothetical protein